MSEIIIRPSGISAFFDCSYKWYRSNISDKPIRSVGIRAHIGSGIHKAAETYYKESINKRAWANSNTDYSSIAIDTFRSILNEEREFTDIDINVKDAEDIVVTCAKSYIKSAEKISPNIPIDVEKKYSTLLGNIEGKKIILQGTLDIVYDNAIGDIKTMSKTKPAVNYSLQQSAYSLLRKLNGESVDDLLIHRVITSGKSVGKTDSVSILSDRPDPVTMENLQDGIKNKLKIIFDSIKVFYKTGDDIIFRGNPTSIMCSKKYCPYFDECSFR